MNLNGVIIDPIVKISDILTLLIIVISLISIRHELEKERILRQKEQADKVRDAASVIISKLDRWKELSLSLFQEIEAAFVETSEHFGDNPDVEKTRDFVWAKLNLLRTNCFEKMLSENIESAYVNLYRFDPSVRDFFDKVIKQLKAEEEVMFQELLVSTQNEILVNCRKDDYKTSDLRNSLMSRSIYIKIFYKERLEYILEIVGKYLLPIISKSDEDLLKKDNSNFDNSNINFPQTYPDLYSEKNSTIIVGELDNT